MPIAIKTVLELRGLHPEAAVAAVKRANNGALHDTIRLWHRVFLPGHFEPSAVAKYRYRKRAAKYMRRKAAVKRHQKPLIWSGQTMRAVVRQIRTTGTAKRARGVMPGSQALNFGWRFTPSPREELTATVEGEYRVMVHAHEKRVAELLRADGARQPVRRRRAGG